MLFFSIFFAYSSCQINPVREVANTQQASVDDLIYKKFEILMQYELSGEKRQSFIKYINRQRDFYYIAQDLMNKFDSHLSKIHKIKTSGTQISTADSDLFQKNRFQLRIAWEFSERNLHELLEMYELILVHANDKTSKHHLAAKLILNQWPQWMETGWNNGDQLAVISLAQELADVNAEFLVTHPNAKTTDVNKYALASKEIRKKAHAQSLIFAKKRSQNLIDSFIAKEWDEFQTQSEQNKILNEDSRLPQAIEAIEPASDGKGTVTGNHFPPQQWALTFDDGPHPSHSQEMYAVLQANGLHGTFCWISKNIVAYPNIAIEAANYGFSRASHSYTHAQLVKLDAAGLDKEITQAAVDFSKVIGQRPTLYRCPYGACGPSNSAIRQLIAKNNLVQVSWNVDTLDWQDKNPQSVFERAKKQIDVLDHGIILFHDIHPQSVEALKLLIPYMKNTKKAQIRPLKEIISTVRGRFFESP